MNVNNKVNLFPAGSLNTKHRLNASMDITSGVLGGRRGTKIEEIAVPPIRSWGDGGEEGTLILEELDRGDAGTVLASPGELRTDNRAEQHFVSKGNSGDHHPRLV